MSFQTKTIPVTLGTKDYVLTPTLGAIIAISNAFGGVSPAYRRVANIDVNAILPVLRAGAGVPDNDAAFMENAEAALSGGLVRLVEPALAFLNLLLNGGEAPAACGQEPAQGEG